MKRNSVIDIMKGILIVFVVMGHAQIPLHRFIYLFHMPVFFMISGYLWNEAHKRIGISKLALKRIKSLYIPFVVCNLFFLILHLCIPGILETQTVGTSATEILKSVFKVLIFRGRATLSDSTWFLSTLFFATIGYAIILIVSMKVGKEDNRVENIVANVVIVVIYAVGCVLSYYDINIYEIGTICIAIALLHLGRFIFIHREAIVAPLNKGYGSNIIGILASGGVLGILLFIANEEIRMIDNEILNPCYFLVASVAGWYFVYGLAMCIEKVRYAKRIFCFLGRISLWILCLHMVSFKLVALIQCYFYGESLAALTNYPIAFEKRGWWILYTLVGIIIPCLVYMLFVFGKNKMKVLERDGK